ncbi:MAG TPA: nucleoside triphosphate pyrophosphohydrolase [Candidatus Andersenbacteria bacterium]|nr:nucleoside triphosphate pyrophosphohydrolase [Candidatus Andersenbacteria bacterium]
MKKKYNKLVRDKIITIIQTHGGDAKFHIASNTEYWQKLKEKLVEEVQEFSESESIEELADILEVIGAISEYKKFHKKKILEVKNKKAEERGKFKKRIILEES